jgi:hypothetical protein
MLQLNRKQDTSEMQIHRMLILCPFAFSVKTENAKGPDTRIPEYPIYP